MQGIATGFYRCFYQSLGRIGFGVVCSLPLLFVQPVAAWQFREVGNTNTPVERLEVRKGPTPASPDSRHLPEPEAATATIARRTPSTVVVTENVAGKALEVPQDPKSVEPLRFHGVLPGETKINQLSNDWGDSFKVEQANEAGGRDIHKYRMKPFRQVDMTTDDDTITMLLIHLVAPRTPTDLANEFHVSQLDPVPIPDEFGEVLGLAYPERGVLMIFDPESGGEDRLVRKIQLEPITPEPFLLRAEYDFKGQFTRDLKDLEKAIELNPRYARAYWLKASVLKETGRMQDAMTSASEAVRLRPQDALFRLTKAELTAINGDYDAALRDTRQVLDQAELSPLQRARGECQLGTLLAEGPENQCKEAMEHHQKAIELAAPLANERHFKTRRLAKRILIDAHLAIARDIAHGQYQQQKVTIRKWVDRSMALVDEAILHDQGDKSLRLDVYLCALQVHGDLKHTGNPEVLSDRALTDARQMISEATDRMNKSRLEWKLATILAEAVRVQRMRGDTDSALRRADEAIVLFKQSAITRQSTPKQKYIVGTLYFRVGSLHAVGRNDHQEAIDWYERARPLLNSQLPVSVLAEADIHGERFVSMGVSYWKVGKREMGIELTERGVEIIQAAVDRGVIRDDILAVPYTNLAAMHNKAGNNDDAKAFAELASKAKQGTTLR